jgi:hypothetical protein
MKMKPLILLLILVSVSVIVYLGLRTLKEINTGQLNKQADLIPTIPEATCSKNTSKARPFVITDSYDSDNVRFICSYNDKGKMVQTSEIVAFYRNRLLSSGWKEIGGDQDQFNFEGHGVRLHLWINYAGANAWRVEVLPL